MHTTYWLSGLARALVYGAFPASFWRTVEVVAEHGPTILDKLADMERRIASLEAAKRSSEN